MSSSEPDLEAEALRTSAGDDRWVQPTVSQVRYDPTFEWLSGGPTRTVAGEGNGQPQRDDGWGLWLAITRPRAEDLAPWPVEGHQ